MPNLVAATGSPTSKACQSSHPWGCRSATAVVLAKSEDMQLTWYNSRGDTRQALCKLVYHILINLHLHRICVRSPDPDLQHLHHGRAISESAGQLRAPASLAWHAERDNVLRSELWASSDGILCCQTVNESRRERLFAGIVSSSTTFSGRLWKQTKQ